MENINPEILIIEDNPNDAELAIRALQKNNISNKIFLVKDGEEALDFLYGRNKYQNRNISKLPKLILLDLKLPKINGLEVLKQIKNDDAKKSIPTIVLTSSKEEKDIIESYKRGANSYIQKPVNFNQFITSVEQIGNYWLKLNELPNK